MILYTLALDAHGVRLVSPNTPTYKRRSDWPRRVSEGAARLDESELSARGGDRRRNPPPSPGSFP